MSFDIAIHKTLHTRERSFVLDVRVHTQATHCVLYGASGAGKTLTLQVMAGLLQAQHGHVRVGQRTLFDSTQGINLPARKRRLGYVYQDYALFPHLSVRQNIGFGLRQGWYNPRRFWDDARVSHWLQALELHRVADHYPHQISGGQRQRTALARALVSHPDALLLDEPFAALDASLRERTRQELLELLHHLRIPLLMITHDLTDVERFGECRILLHNGQVESIEAGLAPSREHRQIAAENSG